MRLKFSNREIIDLAKAWIALSIAFGIVLTARGSFNFFASNTYFYEILSSTILASITVGIGFLLHEGAHKYYAQKYGHFAEFYASDTMLLLAIVIALSPLKMIIALPGAVMISGMITRRQYGKIALAGPVTNFILAGLFGLLTFLSTNNIVLLISVYGFIINTWLGLFNMIPFWELDGKKILNWNSQIYFITLGIGLVLYIIVRPLLYV
jgi:Zn-dependent protease